MNTIDVYRENDKTIPFALTLNDVAVDITGYVLYFTVRESLLLADSSDEPTIQKTVTEHTDPTNGQSQFQLNASDTDIAVKQYYYDITYRDTNNDVQTADVGFFKVNPNTTARAAS